MRRTQLSDYVDKKGQTKTAQQLGCTQAAIRKALQANRRIYVITNRNSVRAEEIKPFPSNAPAEAPDLV